MSLLYTSLIASYSMKDDWFIDSRCSTHMTHNIKSFSKIDKDQKGKIIFRDDNM